VYYGGGADDVSKNPQVKELLDKGDHTVDDKARKEHYRKALNIIADNAYAVPLWSLPVYYVANRELNFRAYSDELPRFWEMSWK
jgi:peptide/nickel transport system substrate-binding protein